MAFGRRLYLTYQDDKDSACLAEIWQEGYGGAATEMTMGSIPVVIRYGGDGWKNLIGSEATVSFFSSADLTWLNTADGQDIKFVYYRAGVLNFTGFALPDQFSDSLGPYPREFTFVASDRVGVLNAIDYVDATPLPYETWESAIVILARALSNTGLSFNLNVVCNLYEDSMASGPTDDPLEQLYVRQDVIVDDDLNPGSCAAIIDIILKSFQCRLFQSAGEWWIWRVPETINDPLSYRVFTSAGVYSDVGEFSSLSQLKTTNTTNFIMLADCTVEGIAPYRDVTIVTDYDKRPSIFRGWKLPGLEFTDETTLRHWYNSDDSTWIRKQSGDDFMIMADNIAALDRDNYIRTEKVTVESSSSLDFIIKWGYFTSGTKLVEIILEPTAGGNPYYCYIPSGSTTGSWIQSAIPYGAFMSVPATNFNNPSETSAVLDGFPTSGDVYIKFYAPYGTAGNYLFISECKLQVVAGVDYEYKATDSQTIEINTNNNLSLNPYTVELSDTPEINNEFVVYRGIAKVGGVSTDAWKLDGAGTGRTLVEWLYQWTGATDSSFRFQGSIRGSSNYFNPIKLIEFNDEVFLWEDVSFNTKTRIWSGRAIQYKGVLLQGATTTVKSSSARSSSGGSGGGGSSPIPFTGYRAAAGVSLTSGDNSVTFSSSLPGGSTYVLRVLALTTTGGYETRGTITNKTVDGFDINVDEDCEMDYTAIVTL
jgi:hypothetical protein